MRHIARRLLLLGTGLTILWGATVAHAAGPTLVAAFFVKGRVGLKWKKVEGVDEYRVYRKPSAGDFELVATVNEDHYFDEVVAPGTTYNYKIAIVGADGKELFSAPKSVTIPGGVIGEFVPPTWVGVRVERDKIYLNWDDVPGAVAYNVYRSSTSGSNYEIVGNTQSSSHADNLNIEAGQTYYYVLTAMNLDFEETAHSEERSIKFGLSSAERDKLAAEAANIKLVPMKLSHVRTIAEGQDQKAMNQPSDVCGDSKGQVYIADKLNQRVHCYDESGKLRFSIGTDVTGGGTPRDGAFLVPYAMHVDADDNLFVSDTKRGDLQMFTADGKFVRRIAITLEEGMKPLRPNGVCRLDANRLMISDTGNHRILLIDMDGNIVKKVGKQGSGEAEFMFPGQIEKGPNGNLYVVDVMNYRIQVLDSEGNFVRAFGSAGQGPGQFGRPTGLAVDETGRVWVTDTMSGMVQIFTLEGEVRSVLGTAQDEWSFAGPLGIQLVGGRLYVVDSLANRVMVFDLG